MNDSATIKRLTDAIGQASKSAKFCVTGSLSIADPGLVVDGLKPTAFPLNPATVKKLVAACGLAPFGKGTQTLVDEKVRKTYELDPKTFRLSDAWNAAITETMRPIAEELGLPVDQLEARIYKLLVYKSGGFFLPHRDSEKHDRMVASLIVALPNPFQGGTLVVRHGAVNERVRFDQAAKGNAPCYAAFYADCEHEVEQVWGGLRVCLAYNLVLRSTAVASPSSKPKAPGGAHALAQSIDTWFARQPADPLVFALEHHYTERGLSLDLLKGGDRSLADLVISAAEKTDCKVHLAQVSRHLLQSADDGSYGERYSRWGRRHEPRRPRKITIGETHEDDLSGNEWADLDGKKQPWGAIAFDLAAIVATQPIDDWKPTSEEYEGFTGNAGNTLDRWYHRSALVVWKRDQHFAVIARSGTHCSIPLFFSMMGKLAKTPKKRLDEARADCVHFARAIISRWPNRRSDSFERYGVSKNEKEPQDEFPGHLLTLGDRDTVAQFLVKLSETDRALKLKSFVATACRKFGATAFAVELRHLIVSQPNPHDRELAPRDIEWLSAFCCNESADADRAELARQLCTLAVNRVCAPRIQEPYHYGREEPAISEKSLPLFLKAIVASGSEENLTRAIRSIEESPTIYNLDEFRVPCLSQLIPWSKSKTGAVPRPLAEWRDSVRQKLEAATAVAPTPPTDWARPAELGCTCPHCSKLTAFLNDPSLDVCRIQGNEERRQHLISRAGRAQCDVKHELERKGSSYHLVFTKTSASYDRALKRYEADRRLLDSLSLAE